MSSSPSNPSPSLASTIASKFYQTGTPLGDIITWLAAFTVGFIVRPFGALIFGRMGDRIGRKYTFLVTMTLMGVCIFLVGLLPTAATIGAAAGIILIIRHKSGKVVDISCRILNCNSVCRCHGTPPPLIC